MDMLNLYRMYHTDIFYSPSLFHREVKMLVVTKLISQLTYGQDERH